MTNAPTPKPIKHALNVTRAADFAAWYQAVITEGEIAWPYPKARYIDNLRRIAPFPYGENSRVAIPKPRATTASALARAQIITLDLLGQ
jgi:hypothetical protein